MERKKTEFKNLKSELGQRKEKEKDEKRKQKDLNRSIERENSLKEKG
jgi:hypothetical protein